LAIAKGIVEAHGGKIWIEPVNKGNGTRVVFTLPIGDDDVAVEPQYSISAAGKV
jgi:signal transduction histidine kinase